MFLRLIFASVLLFLLYLNIKKQPSVAKTSNNIKIKSGECRETSICFYGYSCLECLSDGSHCRSSDPAMAGFDMGTCCSNSCVEHADHPGDYFCAAVPAADPASRKGWSLF